MTGPRIIGHVISNAALRREHTSLKCGKQTVNTVCFPIDVEITGLVDFYCPTTTTELLCIVVAHSNSYHITLHAEETIPFVGVLKDRGTEQEGRLVN